MNFKLILVAVLAAVAGVSANPPQGQQGHQSLGPGKSDSANNNNDN